MFYNSNCECGQLSFRLHPRRIIPLHGVIHGITSAIPNTRAVPTVTVVPDGDWDFRKVYGYSTVTE